MNDSPSPPALAVHLSETLIAELADRVTERVLSRIGSRCASVAQFEYKSVKEVAQYLRANPRRVYDLLSAGRLTRYKDGSRVLFSQEEVETHLAGSSPRPVAPHWPYPARRHQQRSLRLSGQLEIPRHSTDWTYRFYRPDRQHKWPGGVGAPPARHRRA
jgi:excisionase family DNA binding protein